MFPEKFEKVPSYGFSREKRFFINKYAVTKKVEY